MCGGPVKCGGPCSAEHVRTLVNPALSAIFSKRLIRQIAIDIRDAVTDPAHLTQLGQHDDDRRAVFPQHPPEVFGRQRQRRLSSYIRFAQSIALLHTTDVSLPR